MRGLTQQFWSRKRVLLTGHTGFKGSWLALWLESMGAEVHGYALPPSSDQGLFSKSGAEAAMTSSTIADIRDYDAFASLVESVRPEIVFHLAAQSLVRHSYNAPVETYEVNVMGTVHVLEAARRVGGVRAAVIVTSDKCYENREWVWGYRENEAMGGQDPYSSSKGCAELVAAAYRDSFLSERGVAVATARAGNVIGGGDMAEDRLVPDLIRAIDAGSHLVIRNPHAVRPWQHVLEPLSGYLALAERLYVDGLEAAEAWNFGPSDDDARTVEWIVQHVAERRSLKWEKDPREQPHEAAYLKLDSSKARARLGWRPRWPLELALQKTLEWHEASRAKSDMRAVSLQQINEYVGTSSMPENPR